MTQGMFQRPNGAIVVDNDIMLASQVIWDGLREKRSYTNVVAEVMNVYNISDDSATRLYKIIRNLYVNVERDTAHLEKGG